MKKLSTMLLAGALAVSVMGFAARADEIKVWVADNVTDFTNEQIEAFKEANPDFAGYDYVVEPVGEGDAAGNMITDVEAGADIFGFAQDQISRLVSAGALIDVEPENAEAVIAENDPGAVAAATVGDVLYAYPLSIMTRASFPILPHWKASWPTAKPPERTYIWRSTPAGIRPLSSLRPVPS